MVKAQDLVVKGIASQYIAERPIIYCYKKFQDKGALIPCRYNRKKRTYKKVSFPKPKLSLRPEQEKVLAEMKALISKREENAKKNGESIACHHIFGHIYTGFGKSPLGSIFGAEKEGPILIFCDRDSVRQGWVGTWREFFGIEPHVATGQKDEKGNVKLGEHDVCILSIQLAMLHQFSRDEYSHYKTVICDEADTLCTQNAINILLDLAPEYFIGLTATVRRNDGLDKVLDVFWGPRSEWIQRLKEFGETCSMHLHIMYTPFKIESMYNRKSSLDWMGMSQVASNIHERNIMIRNLCLLRMNDKILILTKLVEHVETLAQMLRDVGDDVSIYCGTSKTYYDAHSLIATLSKAGRGYDDKQVSAAFDGRRFDVLILCMTMKDADQALGRALRGEKLDVYLFVDNNSVMQSHADQMRSINTKRGAIVSEEYM